MRKAAVFAMLVGLAVWAPRVAAADSQRAMKWQFSIPMTFTSGASIDGDNGTKLEINDDLGWGFGSGYNLNENFMVGADITWISANYKASIAEDLNSDGNFDQLLDVSGTLDAATFQFVGQYNILKKNVTPFLRANFGWTWIDSNIPSGPPQGSCYWDPWYGYICSSWQPTFEDTAFSYGAAVGVRGEIGDKFFAEGSYNLLWVDTANVGTPSFDGFRLNVGWTF